MKNLSFPGLPRVLVIDDEEGVREGLRALLQTEGLHVETAGSAEDGVRRVEAKAFDIVFLDLNLPGADGLSMLSRLRHGVPPADIVVLTGYGTVANTVESMRKGATDVIEKPFTQDRIMAVVRRCLETRQLKNELAWLHDRVRELTSTEIVGLSPGIRDVQTRIDQVAHAPDTTVLVTGQSGTGKELVARCIHERSARRHGPFVAINCAALTESLLEAELFGYEPGAFTGANRDGKDGLFAIARGGTLFLDEIGEMELTLQAKLLRVLQERTFRRVGGVQDIPADVRIIASTNRDLRTMVAESRFREDLFYRLNVMTVAVPRLRERSEDIPLLSHCFLDQIGRQMGKALSGFTEEAMETLCEYTWPGNVRELRNAIEHACIVCPSGMIDEIHLPQFSGGTIDGSDTIARNVMVLDGKDCSIRALEGQLVAKVLDETTWNISKAASILGINRTTLYNKIRVHNLGKRPGRSKLAVGPVKDHDAGRWAAVLGHELRNPLAAAMTGAAVLRELLDPGDQRLEVADGVMRDLRRLTRLLDSYLDFARARRVGRERLDLSLLCANVARQRPGNVTASVAPGLAVRGSGQLLERSLDNLIDNALQAGARSIRLAAAAAGDTVTITVDDDGPGVPEELRQDLFRAGCSGHGSTGLGLCIVAEVIAAHGGLVTCEPLPRGTRFRIELPAAMAHELACVQPA